MGRGRNRKPRNFATFRLCPRPGAADASDRVFVRVDSNPYSVPGFADDGDGSSSSTAGGDEGNPSSPSSAGGGALPEHVRSEILELGLPDDGYDYLPHLRELRPSVSSTGGSASAAFLPSRRRARFGLPLDVKVHPFLRNPPHRFIRSCAVQAYDASRVRVGSGKFTEASSSSVRRVEEAIDLDVAKLLEESDVLLARSEDEGLEEDFVIVANQPEEEEQIEEEEKNIGVIDDAEEDKLGDGGGKEGVPRLHDGQFDSLALEKKVDSEDGSGVTKGLYNCEAQKA